MLGDGSVLVDSQRFTSECIPFHGLKLFPQKFCMGGDGCIWFGLVIGNLSKSPAPCWRRILDTRTISGTIIDKQTLAHNTDITTRKRKHPATEEKPLCLFRTGETFNLIKTHGTKTLQLKSKHGHRASSHQARQVVAIYALRTAREIRIYRSNAICTRNIAPGASLYNT